MVAKALPRRRVLTGLLVAVASPAFVGFPSRLLNAQDFGIIGDGRTDALPALKKMIETAEANGKGTLKLPGDVPASVEIVK